ncbi:MAG TPA: carboxypeptidase-like regulatory domain-containing protein, partial [Vicinamibacterales bacterium]|nr:carboxypeptidase-like regulatory domain-containing protein [Vicinamibacterales bacterium]
MIRKRTMRVLLVLGLLAIAALPARAQITTGTVSGTVKDPQGGVVPGATVVLISETKGTKSEPAVTNNTGDYVIPTVTADTYTVEITMEGFKTVQRKNVKVSGGDRVVVGIITLEVGGAAETVNVQAESPMIQAQSGERSFAV